MRLTKTLLTTAAAVVALSTGAFAEGYGNTGAGADAGAATTTNDMGASGTSTTNDVNMNEETGMDDESASTTSGVSATSAASVNVDSSTVEQVQTSLNNEGYSLSTDGIWGPRTAEALRQFQQANGLNVTGTVNSETLAALDISR